MLHGQAGNPLAEVRKTRDSFRIGTFKKHQDAAMGQSSLSIHRSVEHRFLQFIQHLCRVFQAFPSPGTSKYDGQCAKPQVRAAFTAREICSKRRFQCERCVKAIGVDPFYPMLIMLFFSISFCLGSLVENWYLALVSGVLASWKNAAMAGYWYTIKIGQTRFSPVRFNHRI